MRFHEGNEQCCGDNGATHGRRKILGVLTQAVSLLADEISSEIYGEQRAYSN